MIRFRHASALLPAVMVTVALQFSGQSQALDLDGDGLSDVFQHRYSLPAGADALTRDSDSDGRRDALEFYFGTDPTNASSVPPTKPQFKPEGVFVLTGAVTGARYGLEVSSNLHAWAEAVAPAVATASTMTIIVTPKPGLKDRKYFRFFAPALQPDGDGDGLDAIEEALLGSSDNDVDSDHDGLPDAWEARYHLALTVANANADPDGDGLTNLQEFQLGTDPTTSNNTAPFVSFLTPSAGAQAVAAAPLVLTLSATDPDAGDTLTVTLFDRDTNLGNAAATGTARQYALTWSSAVAGQRIVLARARDNHGNEAWAALPVSVLAAAADTAAFGPVEGGFAFNIPVAADDLRSSPLVSKPAFAAAIGSVSGGNLTFDEQPGWTPGAYQSGYFLHVRSGVQRGALLAVSGNEASSLTVPAASGLAAGDLIALVPKMTLDELLPADAVHEASKVFTAASFVLPATTGAWYQRGADGAWRASGAGDAVTVLVDPWSCFRVVHATGAASTSFQPMGDVAAGPVKTVVAAHASAQDLAFGVVSPIALSLRESGLADSGMVRNAGDAVDLRLTSASAQTWSLIHRVWSPSAGTADGSAAVVQPGGAIVIHRALAVASTTWTQPAGR